MSWLKHLSAQVVRIMLDYTDHVSFCTKLTDTLKEQNQWPEICHIQSKNGRDASPVITNKYEVTTSVGGVDFVDFQEMHGA